MTIKVVITQKKALNVVERDNVTKIELADPYWNLYVSGSNTPVQYTISDFNVRILGVKQ